MNTEFNIKGNSGCDIKIKKNRVVKVEYDKNYSKRYWSIILGQWLFKFISPVYFRWNLITFTIKIKNEIILQIYK